ncbi:MAG TPA: hypothetical protein VFM29_06370, partial [Vicinamibacteria bacterium]|nr:hypothetical protein [Vicinamibacteria bacterium]
LRPDEVNLVAAMDGVMTLEEICAASRQPDFEACRAVWALWAAGLLDQVPQDRAATGPREETAPHADVRGASVGREIERFNELHRFLFELVCYSLGGEAARGFFERAFLQASAEHAALFEGVAVDGAGELDPIALRRNIVSREITRYLAGLDRLLAIEVGLARTEMGDKKAGILEDGLLAVKERQLKVQS